MIRDLLAPLVTLAVIAVASLLSLDTLCTLHREYQIVSAKLDGETWLREKCQDPLFYANITSHTDICMHALADHRVGAFFLALNRVTGAGTGALDAHAKRVVDAARSLGWQAAACLALLLLVCPGCVLTACRQPGQREIPLSYKQA